MRTVWTLLIILAGFPVSLWSQQMHGEGYYARYGQIFGSWQQTRWPSLEFRTRCDGEQVRGSNAGPIKWTIEYRNRSSEPVTFDYVILPPGNNKKPAAEGEGRIAPGKTFQKLATVPTSACEEGVLTAINHVHFISPDSATASKPDSR
jgi:hypothetical protein